MSSGYAAHTQKADYGGVPEEAAPLLVAAECHHRIVAQLQIRVVTTLALAVDGRAITLEAFHDGIGIASLAKMATISAPFA